MGTGTKGFDLLSLLWKHLLVVSFFLRKLANILQTVRLNEIIYAKRPGPDTLRVNNVNLFIILISF